MLQCTLLQYLLCILCSMIAHNLLLTGLITVGQASKASSHHGIHALQYSTS